MENAWILLTKYMRYIYIYNWWKDDGNERKNPKEKDQIEQKKNTFGYSPTHPL